MTIRFNVTSSSRVRDENCGEIENQTFQNDHRTNGNLTAKNSQFKRSVSARDAIHFETVTVLGSITSTCGGIDASDSKLNEVNVRNEIKFNGVTATGTVQSTCGGIDVSNNSQLDEISVRNEINFNGVTATGTVQSTCGGIDASDSKLKEVRVRNEIKFNGVTADGTVQSTCGGIDASDSKLKEVRVRNGIKFDAVTVTGTATSSSGSVSTKNSKLNDVRVRDGVTIKDSLSNRVSSSSGGVNWINSIKTEHAAQTIQARNQVVLQKVDCQEVNCSSGIIDAKEGRFTSIQARNDITLNQVDCAIVESSSGKIKAERGEFKSLTARENITLSDLQVSGNVKSTSGSLIAKNCTIGSIEAVDKIQLIESTSKQLVLTVGYKEPGIIELDGSSIQGDVVIRSREEIQVFGSVIGRQVISYGGGISFQSSGGKFIATGPVDYINQMEGFCNLNEGSEGTINGEAFVFMKGQFVPSKKSFRKDEEEEKVQEKELKIVISGGTIKGRVIFEDCKGRIVLEKGAQILEENPLN